jgi:ComF family protein
MLSISKAFLDLLFPPTCLACHTLLIHQEKHLCITCLATLPSAELEMSAKKDALMKKFYGLIPFTHAFSLYYFSKKGRVQQLLHSLKYQDQADALLFLGSQIGNHLQKKGHHHQLDLIIPVPLHHNRYQERGYNQSTLLAQGISQVLQIPINKDVLIRNTHTTTQTAKTRQQRWENVAQAFQLTPSLLPTIQNKRILLVDDLVTTGATITASAQHLLAASAHSLSLATLAIAFQE